MSTNSSRRRIGRRPVRTAFFALALIIGVVALPAGAPAAKYAFKPGTYTGKTSQKDQAGDPLPLQLHVAKNKRKVNVVFFEISAPPCGGGGMGSLQYAGLITKISADGSFRAKTPYGGVKGSFDGRKATGTARYEVHQSGVDCDSGRVTWKAKKSG